MYNLSQVADIMQATRRNVIILLQKKIQGS